MGRAAVDLLDEGLSASDIRTVERVMGELLKVFRESDTHGSLAPFLEVYHGVTRSVVAGMAAGRFEDPHALERLDVDFAHRYFEPVRQFVVAGERPEPWQTYLEYCAAKGSVPEMEVVLGINAHINGDLPFSMAGTGYENQQDFDAINGILRAKLVPYLARIALRDRRPGALLLVTNLPLAWYEFRKTIVAWRRDAWANAGVLREDDVEAHGADIRRQTEAMAERFIALRENIGLLNAPAILHAANQEACRL